jgi:CheY-like chemotaxis protein
MMGCSPRQILIIEDDRDIARILGLHLRDCGYGADVAHDGHQGLEQALGKNYDLIMLDLMLPGLEGLEVCRRLRTRPNYTPTLMLTAREAFARLKARWVETLKSIDTAMGFMMDSLYLHSDFPLNLSGLPTRPAPAGSGSIRKPRCSTSTAAPTIWIISTWSTAPFSRPIRRSIRP